MHRRDRRDAAALRDLAGQRAGQAVAPRAERRPGHQHVRLDAVELGADRACGFGLALAGEVVAAHDGRLDARAIAQRLLEKPAGADGAFAHRHAHVRLILAADAPEELVHVVHDAQRTAHGAIPPEAGCR
jgi:hypothetical protein